MIIYITTRNADGKEREDAYDTKEHKLFIPTANNPIVKIEIAE